jgi:hypothetical protein
MTPLRGGRFRNITRRLAFALLLMFASEASLGLSR